MGQATAWDRKNSTGPINHLISATAALRLYDHAATNLPAPKIYG